MKRILIAIDPPKENIGVLHEVIKSLPVSVEAGAFPHGDIFLVEFASKNETDLGEAANYFLENWDLKIIDVLILVGRKQVIDFFN